MFGQFYERRDQEVAGGAGASLRIGTYASHLLADILNRAVALELAHRRHYEAPNKEEREQAAQDLVRTAEVFLDDLEEARTRGLRARVFCRDRSSGALTAESVASQDTLQDLGGELVSAARALNED